jgi:uncharacterized protein with HEPN domain
MDKEIEKFFFDVLESINIIETYCNNITDFSSFEKNLLVQDAVQRRLSIIGEALWKASKLNPSLNVTDLRKIVTFRHILVHDYNKVEIPTIWLVITKHLRILKEEIEILLK